MKAKYKDITQYHIGDEVTYNYTTGRMSTGTNCKDCVFHKKPNDFCFLSNCISWLREYDGKGKNIIFV